MNSNREAGTLWAITAYFNPAGYRRRRANYRVFRERLAVPLVAVELAYAADFELDDDDAEILVQLRGHDILWQKERLLNLALRALPDHCTSVVWMDCDIVFETNDWPERVTHLLEHSAIVQPYSHVHELPRDWMPGDLCITAAESSRRSAAFAITSGVPPAACLGEHARNGRFRYSRGFTWAARRELLDQHGFYDACIIGGGDRAMAGAIYGCYAGMMHYFGMDGRRRTRDPAQSGKHMSNRRRDHYLAWAGPFSDTAHANVAVAEGNLFHLWHGSFEHRRYRERIEGLRRFEFNPFQDIAIDNQGAWRWNSDKHGLHHYVREYFASRREDG